MNIIIKDINGRKFKIGDGQKTFVIAEIGKNFITTKKDQSLSVYLKKAKALIDAAKEAGADAVKFQTHNFEDEQLNINVVSHHFKGSDRYNWVKRNTFPADKFWIPLTKYCKKKDILFFSTPMSKLSAMILKDLRVPLWKIGSGDILDFPMLDFIRKTNKPIIISSGMSTLSEIEKSILFLREKNNNVVLLHCVSKYPCPPNELNLNTIKFFKKRFNIVVGFSDHSLSIDSALSAVALGASVIEKHFSFNRKLWGSDHKVSMTPVELKKMIKKIREIENGAEYIIDKNILGRPTKFLQKEESLFRPLFRKSLVAGRDIKKGKLISADMIYSMRPQKFSEGTNSDKYESILGRVAKVDIKKYEGLNSRKLK